MDGVRRWRGRTRDVRPRVRVVGVEEGEEVVGGGWKLWGCGTAKKTMKRERQVAMPARERIARGKVWCVVRWVKSFRSLAIAHLINTAGKEM